MCMRDVYVICSGMQHMGWYAPICAIMEMDVDVWRVLRGYECNDTMSIAFMYACPPVFVKVAEYVFMSSWVNVGVPAHTYVCPMLKAGVSENPNQLMDECVCL